MSNNKSVTTNIEAEPYTGIYAMHKYWSKKPYNVIRNFIERYSRIGETVLDPFCGSGISVVEAIATGRKAIGVDINPSAIFITRQMLEKVDIVDAVEVFREIEEKVKERINSLYKVRRNGRVYQGTHYIWEHGSLTEVWYQNGNKEKHIDAATEEDKEVADAFRYEDINLFYPSQHFFHNPRINAYGDRRICELFTPRNLFGLSILMDTIENIKSAEMKDFFKFCFTSAVGQTSKMVFVVKKRGKMNNKSHANNKKEVGSWVIGYWTPNEHFEINVWNCFEKRYRKILKAKKLQQYSRYSTSEAENFREIDSSEKNLLLINQSAQSVVVHFPSDSVDYIITDPPHGNRIPYLELSMMWNAWLKREVDYENEIIISESKGRKKDIGKYNALINTVISEICRILKPSGYFSLMFNSLDDDAWINLVTHISLLDFELKKIETLSYSSNSVVQDTRKAGLKTDFIITMQKINKKVKRVPEILAIENDNGEICKIITELFYKRDDEGLEMYEILNYLIVDFLNRNKFFRLSEVISLIETRFKVRQKKWHFPSPTL